MRAAAAAARPVLIVVRRLSCSRCHHTPPHTHTPAACRSLARAQRVTRCSRRRCQLFNATPPPPRPNAARDSYPARPLYVRQSVQVACDCRQRWRSQGAVHRLKLTLLATSAVKQCEHSSILYALLLIIIIIIIIIITTRTQST